MAAVQDEYVRRYLMGCRVGQVEIDGDMVRLTLIAPAANVPQAVVIVPIEGIRWEES